MAKDIIKQAIELYNEAGRLFRETRQLSKSAIKHYQQADEPSREVMKTWLETATRNAAKMQRLLEEIIILGKSSEIVRQHKVYALAHRNLGLFASRRFKPFKEAYPTYLNEAVEHLNTALNLGLEKDKKIVRRLGAAYYQSGKLKEAVEPLKESIEYDPQDEIARYQLCLTYLGLQDKEGAREQYEALKQNPESPHYHLARMLEPMMERKATQSDEAEREELKRFVEGFRRIKG